MLFHYLARVSARHGAALRAAGLVVGNTAAAPVVIWRQVLAAFDAGLDPETDIDAMRASPHSWASAVDILTVLRLAHIQANMRAFAPFNNPVASVMTFIYDHILPRANHMHGSGYWPLILQYHGGTLLVVGCETKVTSPAIASHIFVLNPGPSQCASQDATGRGPSRRLQRALSDPADIRSYSCVRLDAAQLALLGNAFEVMHVGRHVSPKFARVRVGWEASNTIYFAPE